MLAGGMLVIRSIKKRFHVALFVVLACGFLANLPLAYAVTSTPFTPSEINVLVVSRTSYSGFGYLVSDLARSGFNVTLANSNAAGTAVDWTTHALTSNINEYDVVILHQTYSTSNTSSPIAAMSEAEVAFFTNTFGGVLLVTGNSMFRNETDNTWYAFDSDPMLNIEARLGVDFTGWVGGSGTIYNGTFHRESTMIPDSPTAIPFYHQTGTSFYKTALSLDGATQVYNFTAAANAIGLTYFENATGSIGIYLNGIWVTNTLPAANILRYWGLYGTATAILTSTEIQARSEFLGRLLAYAVEQDYNTLIKPQPMAIFRSDDFCQGLSGYYGDTNMTVALGYMYSILAGYDVPCSIATVLRESANYPNSISFMLGLIDEGWEFATHYNHSDFRLFPASQIQTLLTEDAARYTTEGFNQFSTGITPAGYYSTDMTLAMKNLGYYLADLTSLATGYTDKSWNLEVNNTVIIKTGYNHAGGSGVYYTVTSQDAIHYNYATGRGNFSLSIFHSAPTFYSHWINFIANEVGTYAVRTAYENITAEIPDIKFVTNQQFAQYFGKKYAVISSPSRTDDVVSFTVNVDAVPSVATIGKGMLWYRIATNTSSTIQSVTIDGEDWYMFDDYTIRIPAANCDVEVTLGTPSTPHITNCDNRVSATTYGSSQLNFTVNALTGTTSKSTAYCGSRPTYILNASHSPTDYDSSALTQTMEVTHAAAANIQVSWESIGYSLAFYSTSGTMLTAPTLTANETALLLEFSLDGDGFTESTIYCGSLEEPLYFSGIKSYSYSSTTNILYLYAEHTSLTDITLSWLAEIPPPPVPPTVPEPWTNPFTPFFQEGDWLGFLQAAYVFSFGSADLFYGFLIMLFMSPIYIKTRSLLLMVVLWILVGGGIVAAIPMLANVGVFLMVIGVAGLLVRTVTWLR